jgi:DHA3 family tetracycline resistance protein-like MFS transporter
MGMMATQGQRNTIPFTYILSYAAFWAGLASFDGIFSIYLTKSLGWKEYNVFLPTAFMHVLVALFQLPTGIIADKYGRVKSALFGFFLTSVSFVLLGVFPELPEAKFIFPFFFVTIFSLGWSFVSGSFDAWFVDSLKAKDKDLDLTRIFSLKKICINSSIFLSTILYTQLSKYGMMRSIWLISALLTFMPVFLILRSNILKIEKNNPSPSFGASLSFKGLGKLIFSEKFFLAFCLMSASLYLLPAVLSQGMMAHAMSLAGRNPLNDAVFDFFWPATFLASLVGSFLSSRYKFVSTFAKNYLVIFLSAVPLVTVLMYGLFFDVNKASLFNFFFVCVGVRVINGFISPAIENELNKSIHHTTSRATLLSFYGLMIEGVTGAFGLILLFFLNIESKITDLWVLFSVVSLLLLTVSLVLIVFRGRVTQIAQQNVESELL